MHETQTPSVRPNLVVNALELGFAAYERTHALPHYVIQAVRLILLCRTAALGGHVEACPNGCVQRIRYNSCGHRGCPICAYVKIARWLQQQRQQLLACDHDHVIFTMPSALNPLWIANVPQMTTLLFQALRATLMELCGDPAYGGFVPGILAVLQTWGQTLVLHPHLHCLVTGGGLTPEGTWKSGRNGYLLPVRVVMALFRGKFLAVLRQGVRQGRLTLPPGWREQQILNLLNKLGRPKWNVHIRQRCSRPEQVVDYVGRYIRGLPIGNRRMVAVTPARVRFTYRDYRAEEATGEATPAEMQLSLEDFLQRLLWHVPAPGSQRIRRYGVYASGKKRAVARCRAQLPAREPGAEDVADVVVRCPVCGRPLVVWQVLPSTRTGRLPARVQVGAGLGRWPGAIPA